MRDPPAGSIDYVALKDRGSARLASLVRTRGELSDHRPAHGGSVTSRHGFRFGRDLQSVEGPRGAAQPSEQQAGESPRPWKRLPQKRASQHRYDPQRLGRLGSPPAEALVLALTV